MSSIASPGLSSGSGAAASVPGTRASHTGDSPAVIAARQAVAQARSRVDEDHRAHSPGCVAVDQKCVDKASVQLADAQAAAAASSQLSIVV